MERQDVPISSSFALTIRALRIHENGGEVLMSSHTWQYLTPEQTLNIAKAHEARGADITKVVACANTEEAGVTFLR